MGLELARDIGILRADQVQDLDHAVMDGECGARREGGDRDGGGGNEGQDRCGDELDGTAECHEPLEPALVIVEPRPRYRVREPRPQGRQIDGRIGLEANVDEDRERQLAEIGTPEPGCQQAGDPLLAQHLGSGGEGRGRSRPLRSPPWDPCPPPA